ncbi:lysozyme family protein [Vagococcus fluvialis]|uniref:lysozyme family protein n=1 Tax=Vagococcus fluvialis TaxID=2738 RepID=UPI0030F3BADA
MFKKVLLILLLALLVSGAFLYFKLSKQVEQVMVWENEVTKAATNHGMEAYTDVILAIIFTESKGDHVDLMQSSESKYGARNQIFSSEESIDSGVEHLAEVVNEAREQNCDIWTAVQAYNFGSQYINYVAENGKENSLELAETYSRDVLAPLLGNTTQETYQYKHPLALIHNGGKLYRNGGNFYYAESVKWNLRILKWFK